MRSAYGRRTKAVWLAQYRREAEPFFDWELFSREAAMLCEQCHAQMIERPPIRQKEDPNEEQAIMVECPQCGHTEYQPLSYINLTRNLGSLVDTITRF